jgi:hypothetical protein
MNSSTDLSTFEKRRKAIFAQVIKKYPQKGRVLTWEEVDLRLTELNRLCEEYDRKHKHPKPPNPELHTLLPQED